MIAWLRRACAPDRWLGRWLRAEKCAIVGHSFTAPWYQTYAVPGAWWCVRCRRHVRASREVEAAAEWGWIAAPWFAEQRERRR